MTEVLFVIGFKLDRALRTQLLTRHPPLYAQAVADHVTLLSPVPETWPLPPEVTAAIIGEADDGAGVQAMVARIDGTSDRPDGGTYHITWSLASGRQAVESNAVIAKIGWHAFAAPIPITLTATRWPSSRLRSLLPPHRRTT